MKAETARRYIVTVFAFIFISCLLGGWLQANVQEWAKASGQDQYLVKYAGPAMDKLEELTRNSLFLAIAWSVIGGSLILWLDYALRRRTKTMGIVLLILGVGIICIAGWILTHPVERSDALQSTKSNISDAERAAIIAPFETQINELKSQLASNPQRRPTPDNFAGKEYTQRTIRELRAIYEGRTRLQADAFIADEKGKLIEVSGNVVNVDNGMAFLQVGQTAHNGMVDYVECRFSPTWNTKLGTYRQNELMKIRGVIGPSQNGAQIYLQECEIIG